MHLPPVTKQFLVLKLLCARAGCSLPGHSKLVQFASFLLPITLRKHKVLKTLHTCRLFPPGHFRSVQVASFLLITICGKHVVLKLLCTHRVFAYHVTPDHCRMLSSRFPSFMGNMCSNFCVHAGCSPTRSRQISCCTFRA